jgi:hypothetical protein
MSAISAGDWKLVLGTLATSPENTIAVYQWPQRFQQFIETGLDSLRRDDIDDLVREHPFLAEDIPSTEDRLTTHSDELIVAGRAWLWSSKLYRGGEGSHRFDVNCSNVAKTIYSSTIAGQSAGFPIPIEYSLIPGYRLRREFACVPVTNDATEDSRSRREMSRYIQTISTLQLLRAEGIAVGKICRSELNDFKSLLSLKSGGRFRTLPCDVVMNSLRDAICFVLERGDSIVDSYIALATRASDVGSSVCAYATGLEAKGKLRFAAGDMTLTSWTITSPAAGCRQRGDFYEELRGSPGVYEAVRILLGASQVVIGSLSARRVGELVDLYPDTCLDASQSSLVFLNRKSGLADLREEESRPIPPVAVASVRMLKRLREGLASLGISVDAPLFAFPKAYEDGFTSLTQIQYCASIDLFCDFSQVMLDENGRRYYLRQHQLRRWFAMLFFWGNSFGGVETLRWFLGHTDMEHLYHYVTEVTPGETLRTITAAWAVDAIRHEAPETRALAEVVRLQFGTSDFRVLDEQKVCAYLEQLIERQDIVIEPEFLDAGRTCRIVVKITGSRETA